MVGHALEVAVDRVEGVARVGRRHDPAVVRLVQRLVHGRVVQPAVDEVDAEVGEADEQGELQHVVPPAGALGRRVVHARVAPHLAREPGHGEDAHDGQRDDRLSDLLGDLVLEVLGVVEGGVVEDEEVGEGGAEEVDDGAEEAGRGFSWWVGSARERE